MSYLAGSQFSQLIQNYNRILVVIFSIIGFLKSNSNRYSSNINLSQIIGFFVLSIPSIVFGFFIFGESSFKPLAYGIASIGAFIVPPNKNLVNNLFKLFIIFFIFEIAIVFLSGGTSGPLGGYYLWRKIFNIALPRLYGPLLDTHTSWTLFSYISLLKFLFFKHGNLINFNVFALLSMNYQNTLQNFFTSTLAIPNIKKSYLSKGIKKLLHKKLNYSLIFFTLLFIIIAINLARLNYFNPTYRSSIVFALNEIFNFESFFNPLFNSEYFVCIFTGCSIETRRYDEFVVILNIFEQVYDIGFFRMIFEFGIIYLIYIFYIYRLILGPSIFVFFILGLIHYPVVMGVPFAFYIPYLFRCCLYKSDKEKII